ncbi:MAG: acetyl-CoA C-acetyltransferase [Candidatus Azotimanducaceae bacterium]|jgi:acetyl-CoA C-acetyltransferase
MNEAWIIDAARTPRGIGKKGKGALAEIHPQKVLSTVLRALVDRTGIKTEEIDDVIMSCSHQFMKQGNCIARMAALDAGFSINASGVTLDRFCGGGITSVNLGAATIMSGMEDLIVAGGVEVMSYYREVEPPNTLDAGNHDLRNTHPQLSVGIAADVIASEEGFSREALDAFSAESQRRTGQALTSGAFGKSLVPVYNSDGSLALDTDQYPRPNTTAEQLGQLQPAFSNLMKMDFADSGMSFKAWVEKTWPGLNVDHRHHAGSSSGIVDGAAALILASSEYARSNNLKPRARVRAMANMGHSPEYILNGPVDAAKKVLRKAGMTLADIDLFEVNEAFAVVPLKFMRDLNVDHDKLNVNGGAIALGHPIGATGSMLIGTVLDELERRDKTVGLVTMCAAGGMAPAIIVERI